MNNALHHLRDNVAQNRWGYHRNGPSSSEPVALACLSLCVNGLTNEAQPLADWLEAIQSSAGSVGVTREQNTPAWPTSLAMCAWQAYDSTSGKTRYDSAKKHALSWALKEHGKALPQLQNLGHNTELVGWSWAAATHSWMEPTCFFVLALKALGHIDHPRIREGVRLIIDRLLDRGGCNYGNTRVLGQPTLPHIQPTGLALLAIASEECSDQRVDRSLDYLTKELSRTTATASLCFALLGLTAHDHRPANAEALLEHALQRELDNGPSCYKLALLTLASERNTEWTDA